MDAVTWIVVGAALSAVLVVLALSLAGLRGGLSRAVGDLARGQQELGGRVAQLADSVERGLVQATRQLSDGLAGQSQQTGQSLAQLGERLAVIDAAQRHIAELSKQVVGLSDILGNKQARGAFGEVQLENLVQSILPPSAYAFQATLGNGRRVDCLLQLPNPPGTIAVDAKFPLESYHQLRAAGAPEAAAVAGRAFAAAVRKHIADVADRYIVAGETAESALLFLPSEAVYAELHSGFPQVVEESYRRRVFIVSPTTLMATLNTVRAVLRDARMREAAGAVQDLVRLLLDDVRRLDERVASLSTHFKQASADIEQVKISSDKISRRVERIDEIEVADSEPEARLGGR